VQAACATGAALTAAPAGQLAAADLARALRVLDISLSEAGRPVRRSRFRGRAVVGARRPAARLARAANLARIADILERNLKPARNPRGVREPAAAYAGASILELVRDGRDEEARALLEQAFDWSRTGLMRHLERGGTYLRVVDPAWADPLDASFSRRAGGRWNPPGFAALYLCRDLETARANAAGCSTASRSRSTT